MTDTIDMAEGEPQTKRPLTGDRAASDAADQAAAEGAGQAGPQGVEAGPSLPADRAEAAATVEAILFASDSPLPPARISAAAELSVRAVRQAIADLNDRYGSAGAAFRIEAIAGGYQMLTLAAYHDVLSRLLRARSQSKLSQAALETLAIVAYRQPIMRADVEAIRGVACGEMLRSLMEKGLVKIIGRADVLGRPMLYGTTKRFLEVFGLAGLDDLPRVEELRSGAEPGAPPAATTPQPPAPPGEGEGTSPS